MPADYRTWEESLRSSERGLKYRSASQRPPYTAVAPFVGAWIEIYNYVLSTVGKEASLRSSERGLKSGTSEYSPQIAITSLRSSERGLKSQMLDYIA